jgi:aspartate/methionine/tyrosine aminotransferase
METIFPPRLKGLTSFLVMDILEKAKEIEVKGEKVIHFEIGEPDFDTPIEIKKAALEAIDKGETHYTHSLGREDLRIKITRYYSEKYGVTFSPEQVVVTSGTSPAMLLALSVLLEPGDEVIMTRPYYACYPNFVRYLGGKTVFLTLDEDEGFQIDVKKMKKLITKKTRFIFINSPSNPTGAVINYETLKEIADLDIYVLSDEIYHNLTYREREHTFLEFTDKCFIVNGFSKAYAMTGWRLGFLIAPEKFIRPLQILQQNFFICPSSISQAAALAALDCEKEVEEMKKIYEKRRDYFLPSLQKLGFKIPYDPKGAFYILAKADHIEKNSYELALDILEKAKVAVTPGIDFGVEGYLRFSYATSLPQIEEGIKRLENYLKERA